MSSAWKSAGSEARWRRVRRLVLERNAARNGGRCEIAFAGTWTTRDGAVRRCGGRATCVHHTRGRTVTGDDPRYCVAACGPCNQRVGDPRRGPDPQPTPRTEW